MLLALSVALCGGSLYATQPGAVLQARLADRATELRASDRDAVAQLMLCLAEAAKELQKHPQVGATGGRGFVLVAPATALLPHASFVEVDKTRLAHLSPHCIGLPPPTRA